MKLTSYIEQLLQDKNSTNGKLPKIAFIEGGSTRMIAAAKEVKKMGLLDPVLIFNSAEAHAQAELGDLGYLVIGEDQQLFDELVKLYVEKRKGKETIEDAKNNLAHDNYFAAMLVEAGKVAGAIGGVHHPTSDILRAAFKGVGPVAGVKTISSVMLMHKDTDWFVFTDISVNVSPTTEQIYEIAKNAAAFGKTLNIKDKVAFLSFSTAGSAKTPESTKMREATIMFNENASGDYKAIGEVQFDAAFNLDIRKSKYKYEGGFTKAPTIFVFPDLNAGNIGYKIAQRMGNWGAIGPIITGLKKPINDLSRGSTVEDIKYTAIITALQAG